MPLLITVSAAPLSYTVNVPDVTVGNSTERGGVTGTQVAALVNVNVVAFGPLLIVVLAGIVTLYTRGVTV